jgi:hypothetical protein
MNTDAITRSMRIDMITGTKNPFIEYFDIIWSELSVVDGDIYHQNGGEYIYYINGKTKEFVFYIDMSGQYRMWCSQKYYTRMGEKFVMAQGSVAKYTQALTSLKINTDSPIPYLVNPVNNRIITDKLNFDITPPEFMGQRYIELILEVGEMTNI